MKDTTVHSVTAEQVYIEARNRHRLVRVQELSDTYQAMMSQRHREMYEAVYTPPEITGFMTRSALDEALEQAGSDPSELWRIVTLDPFCGCGNFLVESARRIGYLYAQRRCGHNDPARALVQAATVHAIRNCVFGIDLDPVAVDLARLALWLESDGLVDPAYLQGAVTCGDTFAGAWPPALERRWPADAAQAGAVAGVKPRHEQQVGLFDEDGAA